MTLEHATAALLAAIEAEDLEAVAHALAERGSALHSGAQPTLEVIENGQRARLALITLQQKWALEGARLSQVSWLTAHSK